MFAFTSLVVLAIAALGARADLVISTPPSLTLCQKANFQVTGSNGGSLYAVVVKASDPCGDPLKEIDVTGTFDWVVNVPAGETVMLAVEDEHGNEAWTGALKIQDGDSSCLTGASASTSTSATVTRSSARPNGNGAANAASAPTSTDATGAASRPMVAGAAVAGIAAAIAAIVF
ncbi:hypothetical protein FRB91_009218 [Serendipita sp. 411]|nr:hypothetical protein FRC18_004842 [Serendipita sp. 400]KAG8861307.1 hypothetical protein FRB91_009218 [Serendipita sp. 411]